MREAAHPVAPVARDLWIPKNVLYCWRVQHQQAETHCTTRATQGAEAEALTHVKREVARGTPEQNPGDPQRVPRDLWQSQYLGRLDPAGTRRRRASHRPVDAAGGDPGQDRQEVARPIQSTHRLPVALNTLNHQFTVTQPNRVWAGDIT